MTTSTKLLVSLLVFSGVTITLLSGQLLVFRRQTDNLDRANFIEDPTTEKLFPSPTISSKSDGYKQGSVKSATKSKTQPPQNYDPIIECQGSGNCEGRSIWIKDSACRLNICCESPPGDWKIMSRSDCDRRQMSEFSKRHKDEEQLIVSPVPTAVVPNLAAICASAKEVQKTKIVADAIKVVREFYLREDNIDYVIKKLILQEFTTISEIWMSRVEAESEKYCLEHNGDMSGFTLPPFPDLGRLF